MKRLFFLLLAALATPLWANVAGLPEAGGKCPVCRMNITARSKAVFSTTRPEGGQEKTVHLCSYSCAHANHKGRPDAPLFAHDFETGEAVRAADAWYVVKSAKVGDLVEFAMPPVVAAFKDEGQAKALQQKLKDGAVVHGISAVDKTYDK
jgi:hypothetical protein